MIDLTNKADSELSTMVFESEDLIGLLTDEGQYVLYGFIKGMFKYTDTQYRVLVVDVKDFLIELEENRRKEDEA